MRHELAAVMACGTARDVRADTPARHASSLHALESTGRPPAVLFIHGFGQSSIYWQEWVELLGDCGIRAIAVDLPGFGQSALVKGPYTMEAMADAVARFIEERRLGAVTLAGSSMGSTVAQFVTLRHPRLVRRLLLTATSASPPPRISAPLDPVAARNEWAKRDTRAMVDGFFASGSPPADRAAEATEANQNWTTLERLPEIKVPTLIIQGRHDAAKSPQQGELMAGRMPRARVIVLENSSHTPQSDEPEAFRQAALPFLLDGRRQAASCGTGQ